MIDLNTKEQIKTELDKYVRHSGSQMKAATALGVSNAYISQILSDKSESVSDEMWRKISKNLGIHLDEKWFHAETKVSKKYGSYFEDARQHGNVFGLVSEPGSGKTDMLDFYTKNTQNVFYVKAERHMTEKTLLRLLLLTMGKNVTTGGVTAHVASVKNITDRTHQPVIILDEMEKVSTGVMLLFIDLYNALWKRCGIVMIGTHNLRDRIELGNERGKMGYNEILSRLGGKLIDIPAPDEDDARAVIVENGVTDPMAIGHIINGSRTGKNVIDLRRVERLVHAHKQKYATS
jgi:plasmid maintenance system antidote protein VapI